MGRSHGAKGTGNREISGDIRWTVTIRPGAENVRAPPSVGARFMVAPLL